MEILLEKLRHFKSYCYWSGAKAKASQRLWWQGYLDCLEHVIALMKEVCKNND